MAWDNYLNGIVTGLLAGIEAEADVYISNPILDPLMSLIVMNGLTKILPNLDVQVRDFHTKKREEKDRAESYDIVLQQGGSALGAYFAVRGIALAIRTADKIGDKIEGIGASLPHLTETYASLANQLSHLATNYSQQFQAYAEPIIREGLSYAITALPHVNHMVQTTHHLLNKM